MDNAHRDGAGAHTISAMEAKCRELLLAIIKRDEEAIAAFYDLTLSRVYGVARRITLSPEVAEEVVTDVYLQVWQQADRFDAGRGNVLTWLLTICRSRALDCLRRRDKAECHPEPETLRVDLQMGENDPHDLLFAVERNSELHAALEMLTPTQRQLISLAFFKGLSHQEISDTLGQPLGSVKTHIRKALLTLHQALSPNKSLLLDEKEYS